MIVVCLDNNKTCNLSLFYGLFIIIKKVKYYIKYQFTTENRGNK
jgi:hypothetical protein